MSGLTVMNGGKRRGRRSRGVGRKSRKSPVAKRGRGSKRRSGSKRRRGLQASLWLQASSWL